MYRVNRMRGMNIHYEYSLEILQSSSGACKSNLLGGEGKINGVEIFKEAEEDEDHQRFKKKS